MKFRTEILNSILNAFDKMQEEDKTGVKPMYRNREWNREERDLLKYKKKSNWWNNDNARIQYKSVLFVTPTPGAILAKQVQKREEEFNKNNPERIKVVEKGGLKVKDIISSKNPFKKSECTQKMCPMCTKNACIDKNAEEVKIPCNTHNVGYR